MTVLDRSVLERSVDAGRSARFDVALAPSFAPVLDLWRGMAEDGAALPFQGRAWLEAWSATFGREPGTEVIAATIRDRGAPVMGLPLVRHRVGWRRTIEFADGGLADYNAPILASGAPSDAAGAKAAWSALSRALPASDVIELRRLPHRVGGLVNPLALLAGARPSTAVGLALVLPGSVAQWRQALPRRYRMELGRCDRLFDGLPGARFVEVAENGARIYQALETLQRQRIAVLGLPYDLDRATPRAFYKALAEAGEPGLLTAMVVGREGDEEVVAVLFGLREGSTYTMLRLAAAGGGHARLSPGRQIITRTIEALAAKGVRTFDFALGDYDYKRRLGGEPVALVDMLAARSPLGLYALADFRTQAFVRADPTLKAMAKRIRAALSPKRPA